jgi:hypothetical protein
MRVIRRAIIDEQAGEMTLTTAERLHFGAERRGDSSGVF